MPLVPGDILQVLRVANHDCLNHYQVIAGYLQLGRSQDALSYLLKTVGAIQAQGSILRWVYPTTVLVLLQFRLFLLEMGKKLYLENETDLKEISISEDELSKLLITLLKLSADHLQEDGEFMLRVSENHTHYIFALSSAWDEKKLNNLLELIKEKTGEINCRLHWVAENSKGRLICTVPKKTASFG